MLYFVKDQFVQTFKTLTDHSHISERFLYKFKHKNWSLNKLLLQDKFFIYPLFIGTNRIFLQRIPAPPTQVVKAIKNKKGVAVFFYLNEGNVHTDKQVSMLEDWAIESDLKKENIIFIHSNLLLENRKSKYITFKSFSFFESDIWHFGETERLQPKTIELKINEINSKPSVGKKYYFNCLNRAPRSPRIFLVSLLNSHTNIKEKCITTLGDKKYKTESYNINDINFNKSVITDSIDLNNLNKYLDDEFDNLKNFGLTYDLTQLSDINTHKVNFDIYDKSFISIIGETNYHSDVMFLSEKTFRSISIKQPFFILGNRHSLKYLKSLGYKTFDKWWDESYDTYEDIYQRTYKAFEVIKNISKLSENSLSCMVEEMQEVLDHNFYHFFNNTRHKEFFGYLKNLNGSI